MYLTALSLGEAWTLWFSNQLTSDATIWGVSLLWWGRLGKILQFVGGVTVVAEIIGPHRIRAFGQSLHTRITRRTVGSFVRNGIEWYKLHVKFFFVSKQGSTEEAELLAKAETYGASSINTLLTLAFLIYTVVRIWGEFGLVVGTIFVAVSLIIYNGVVCPLITLLLIASGAIIGLLVDVILIEPIAWVLERPSLDRIAKLSGLIFFIVGFHFDLLTS